MIKRSLIFLFLLTAAAHAVLIPANRLTTWTPGVTVGVQGGIQQYITGRTNIITVTGIDPTGVVDARPAIQAAINAAPVNSVVYIPAGTYRMNGSLGMNDKTNITLRGAGMDATIFKPTAGDPFISIFQWQGGFNSSTQPIVTGGLTKGSTVLTLADTSYLSPFPVGFQLQLFRSMSTVQTDNPFVWSTQAFNYISKQVVTLVSRTPTTVTIFPPINADFWGAPHTVRLGATGLFPREKMGLEDFTIDLAGTSISYAISLEGFPNSWIKGVKMIGLQNYGIGLGPNVFVEVRKCVITGRLSSSSNGAGIITGYVSGALIEDNIIYNMFPNIEVNNGASGNVFAYNFCANLPPVMNGLFTISTNHQPHNAYNLYEGNVSTNIISDGNSGSASHDTIFRNWLHHYEHWYAVNLKKMTRQYSIVGNIIGRPAAGQEIIPFPVYFGQPNIGNFDNNGGVAPPWAAFPTDNQTGYGEFDSQVEPTTIMKGNFYFGGHAMESLGGDTLPNSLYLPGKPAWFGNLTWPPVNPSAPGTPTLNQIYEKIPAGYRFVNGVDPPGVGTPDTTPPTLTTKVINAAGTQLTLSFNETVSIGLGGNGGWTLNMTGGAVTVTGSPTVSGSTITWNLSRTIAAGQTGTVSYVQPGNGVEDTAGNDLASLSNSAVTNTASGDTAAPMPNPSTFGIAPSALTSSTITMTATTATDATPPVQYFFNETSGNAGGSDSGWQSSATFTDAGLAAGTQYRYRVQARDSAVPPNVTTFSAEVSATTKSVAGAHPARPFNMARANIVTP